MEKQEGKRDKFIHEDGVTKTPYPIYPHEIRDEEASLGRFKNKVCCVECGIKYLTEKQKENAGVATSNIGVCCVCGKTTDVVSIRYYNYLHSENQNKK